MRPRFVPADYLGQKHPSATLWSRGPVPLVAAWVEAGAVAVARCLDRRLSRRLHVVVYDSGEACDAALGRRIHPTALLAPVHLEDHALIALHAPQTDPLNRDGARMLRLLCHEIAHVHVAEATGSIKVLGDDDSGMRVRPWVDEGIAVCASALATHDPSVIERAASRSPSQMDEQTLNEALRDLDRPERSAAFAQATMRVWAAAQVHGLPDIVRRASHPEWWSAP